MITSLVTVGFAPFQRGTTAASKEENAIVERANKEVNRHLRAFVFDIASSVRWSFGLSMIQRIINTTVHSGIGIEPAQLVFASYADLDRGILFEWATPDAQSANNPPARMNAFVAELFRIQAQVLETTPNTSRLVRPRRSRIRWRSGKATTSCCWSRRASTKDPNAS
jgi:hypothetical protein